MRYPDVFNFFEKRTSVLKEEYQLGVFYPNPCGLQSIGDLKKFIQDVSSKLFEANSTVLNKEPQQGQERVYFEFEGQELYFEIDPKFKHIQLDFSKVLDFMGELTGRIIRLTNPTGVMVSGYLEDIIEAWKEGLPIHPPGFDFWHRNYNGIRFQKEEIQGRIIVKRVFNESELLEGYLEAINEYLIDKEIRLSYTKKQVKFCQDTARSTNLLVVSGYSALKVGREEGQSFFINSFSSQLFLRWLGRKGGDFGFEFIGKKGNLSFRDDSILEFVSSREYENAQNNG